MRRTPHQILLATLVASVALSLFAVEQGTALILSALAVYAVIAALGVWSMRLALFGPTYCVPPRTHRQAIALTFDDGPDPALTPDVLDVLGRYDIRATFFLIGEKVRAHPDLVRRIDAGGHTIGSHDLRHGVASNFRLKDSFISDIGASLAAIHAVTGRTPALYRPPVGLTNPQLLAALDHLGLYCIGWNRSVRDAGNRRLHRIERLPDLARGGTVAILHDVLPRPEARELYLERLEALCRRIRDLRLHACSVDEVFGLPAYTEEAGRTEDPDRGQPAVSGTGSGAPDGTCAPAQPPSRREKPRRMPTPLRHAASLSQRPASGAGPPPSPPR